MIIPEVNELLEKRNRKSKSSGLDLDAFITDDNDGIQVSPIANENQRISAEFKINGCKFRAFFYFFYFRNVDSLPML